MTIATYTSTFTPLCTGGINTSGVITAASAYDFFDLGSGALATVYNSLSSEQNKAFIASIAQNARAALLPLVKAEAFAVKFTSTKVIVLANIVSILSDLSSIQDAALANLINDLVDHYNSCLNIINNSVDNLKSFDHAIFNIGTATLDDASSVINTKYQATTTTGVKNYLSTLLDLEVLAQASIPAITAVNGNAGNALSLASIFTNMQSSVGSLNTLSKAQALNAMTSQNIFDTYCIAAQGYASSGYTGWYSDSASMGIIAGIDYEIHLTGTYQSGVAASGVIGAPSIANAFWT
jgi:hypothetical protein